VGCFNVSHRAETHFDPLDTTTPQNFNKPTVFGGRVPAILVLFPFTQVTSVFSDHLPIEALPGSGQCGNLQGHAAAAIDPGLPRSPDAQPNVMATPINANDASEAQTSRVELTVENAKLTARQESQEDLIGELREDKTFMREQIIHQRGNDTPMSDMHRETLQTLKAVSVAG